MWDDARAYDAATRPFTDDIRYWEGVLAELRPRRVLDLGCGTGRLSIPLARAGLAADPAFRLTGLDASPPFLAAAERWLAAEPADLRAAVRFVEGDMAGFAFAEPFDLVIAGFNNLAYLIEPEARLGCADAVRRHLTPGGRFGIDLFLPDLAALLEAGRAVFPPMRRELDWRHPAPEVERFVAFYTTEGYDTATQTEATTHYWQFFFADGRQQTVLKSLRWHHYFPSELRLLLAAAGLAPVAEYGRYDRTPFAAAPIQYLWLMEGV